VTKSSSVWFSRSLSRNTCKYLKDNVSTSANTICLSIFVSYSAPLLNTVTAIQYCSGNSAPRTCIMLSVTISVLMRGFLISLFQHCVRSSYCFIGLYGLHSQGQALQKVWPFWPWRQMHSDLLKCCDLFTEWHNMFLNTGIFSNTVVSTSNLTQFIAWIW
jgi:hypothetical protein